YSYIMTADLSDNNRENIMNNVSLKSDDNYLLYWIYNGRGELEDALDKAKFLDDPILIIHGLIQQIEETKSDPELSGEERDEKLKDLNNELDDYKEEYGVGEDEEAEDAQTTDGAESVEQQQDADDSDEDKEAN